MSPEPAVIRVKQVSKRAEGVARLPWAQELRPGGL